MKKPIRPIRIEGKIAYITLTQGLEAIIDAADAPLVDGVNWRGQKVHHLRYATSGPLALHRVIIGAVSGEMVDHRNGDGLDNRRENLRIVTHAQNMINRGMHKNNKCGAKGVYAQHGRWRARITLEGVKKHLGYFDSIEDASAAYEDAARIMFGEFVRGP